jgi:hypothetical protein
MIRANFERRASMIYKEKITTYLENFVGPSFTMRELCAAIGVDFENIDRSTLTKIGLEISRGGFEKRQIRDGQQRYFIYESTNPI